MIGTLLVCCALLGSDGAAKGQGPADKEADLAAYRAAESKAGHDANAHVRLALWCEAHGLTAERLEQLSLAILYDPSNALARGLLGLVAYHGKWDRPEAVGRKISDDPARQALVREYLARRVHTRETAEAQMKLAAWCEEHGLKEQAAAHYTAVTQLDPDREAAWKHLGYKKQGGRWVKPEDALAVKKEAAQQKQADKHWKTKLEHLRDGLESKDAARRAKAEQELAEVNDPRAVPMIWAIFVRGAGRRQIAAVQLLAQIDGPTASNALAALAVFSPIGNVRGRATEVLRLRDPRDVVGRLIGLVHKPFKYQVRHVNGPGLPGELFVEGERFNIQRFYQNESATAALSRGRIYTPDVAFDPFSYQNIALATMSGFVANQAAGGYRTVGKPGYSITVPFPISPEAAASAGQAIAADPRDAAAILNQLAQNPANRLGPAGLSAPSPGAANGLGPHLGTGKNAAGGIANSQAGLALGMLLNAQPMAAQQDILIGQELVAMRLANLSLEQRLAMDVQFVEATNGQINEFNARALPILKAITGQDLGVEPEKWKGWWTDQLGYAYESNVPATKPTFTDFVNMAGAYTHSACFAAGTLVQTLDGPQAIESIRVGDRVLTQGTSTGVLTFQPVVATHRTPSNPTLRIKFGDETIVATGIHRFWKAGKGWTMARELRPGDSLRQLGGTSTVESITSDQIQPVFNLDIAENRDFFVGNRSLLVHDFSFVQPVSEPFDRQPN